MTGWERLGAELDRWGEMERTATFWWRDDDAEAATNALAQLLAIQRGAGAPLAIAVVPANADDGLTAAISGDHVDVLQHGFTHANHATEGQPKCELVDTRPVDEIARELRSGRDRLETLFGARALPVLVPPWNRMSATVLDGLAVLGYRGVSMFKARDAAVSAPGVTCVNTHIDIIDWRSGRGFRGEDAVLTAATEHLAARRSGRVDPTEPTGLLTHHLIHDHSCAAFLERFARAVNDHGAARWESARDLFGVAR